MLTALASTLLVRTAAGFELDEHGRGQLAADAWFHEGFESGGKAEAEALEGSAVRNVTTEDPYRIDLAYDGTAKRYAGRFFARGAARAELVAAFSNGRTESVSFFPTGRMTSDGWYELELQPVVFDGATVTHFYLSVQPLGDEAAEIDAIELTAETAPPPSSCHAAGDCETDAICVGGTCVADSAGVPGLPAAADGAALAAALQQELHDHFGGLASRRDHLADALAALEAMKGETSAGAYWHHLTVAMHALHDSHSYASVGARQTMSLGACFVEGVANVSGTGGTAERPDILVSHALAAADFHGGDQLVSVDGMHPIDFLSGLGDRYQGGLFSTDSASHSRMVQKLIRAIPLYAREIEVAACHVDGTCELPVTHDVRELATPTDAIECDFRFLFPTEGAGPDPVSHESSDYVYLTPLSQTPADSGLSALLFDSFEAPAADPFTPLLATVRSGHGVLVDHRPGGGGLTMLASEISGLFRPKVRLGVFELPQAYLWQDSVDQAAGKAFFDAADDRLEDVKNAGSEAYDPTLRVALITLNGASAGDFFPYLMSGPKNVRVFGQMTQGAFSTAVFLSYHQGLAWGFGSGDTFAPDGTALIGHGFPPDEIVLPVQHDLLVGKDTLLERARDWLTTCTDCVGP